MKKELEDILNDIEILRSPNASKIIEVVLDNLIKICEPPYEKALERLIDYENTLQANILIQRSCHVAIKKVLNKMKHYLRDVKPEIDKDRIETTVRFVKEEAMRVKKERIDALTKLRKNAAPLLMDGGNILLFGYSDCVLSALEDVNKDVKESITIYICECRNKTRYEHDNKLVYSDAIHYASEIKKKGFNNIKIISDCTVANLFSRKGKDMIDKVILGANGIDKDFQIGHTVGHLMIADLSRAYGIPVYVIVELLKFGDFEHQPDLERDNEWLTTTRSYHDQLKNISIINYREDIVPPDKVDFFITDVGIFPSKVISKIKKYLD